MRYAVGLEYDGSAYAGWQKQADPKLITLQSTVEAAFTRVADHPVFTICAGRTDAGVHATSQVLHFDSNADRTEYAWVCGVNSLLPRDVSVSWVKPMPDDFHARFLAMQRRYHYWIYNHPTRPAVLNNKVTWHMQPLDAQLMQAGANYLIGEYDFSSFRARNCQAKSPVKTIRELKITRSGSYIKLDIAANAFLYHMVRNIVGVLLAVGEGKQKPDWVKKVLDAIDREAGEITAAPQGLYLVEIKYPESYEIGSSSVLCYNSDNQFGG